MENICRGRKKICTTEDLSLSLEALLACRLIPLGKNPGLQPIRIGKALCYIASKIVVSHIWEDAISVVGSLQVRPGQYTGCESLIHAIHTIYKDQSSEAVLLVDTPNAFNSIIRNTFLHKIGIICLPLAKYVWNCYYANTTPFIIGGDNSGLFCIKKVKGILIMSLHEYESKNKRKKLLRRLCSTFTLQN